MILLTPNEVDYTQKHPKEMVLYILHSVKVSGRGKKIKASAGTELIVNPWNIKKGKLKPVSYLYELPGSVCRLSH